jgi:hypothetical protein
LRKSAPALAAIAACFVAQVVVSIAAIPPWQNPDEPQHLMTVRLTRMHGSDFVLERDLDRESERTIVESMARYDWWRHYGRSTPQPLPLTFADGPERVVAQYFGPPGGGSRLYYRAVAGLFDLGSIDRPLPQLYAMRILSALAAILSLCCIWSGTRTIVDDIGAGVVTALVVLHPQFVIVSTSASPDAFVNLAGSIVWRQAAVLVTSGTTIVDVAVMWCAALAALVLRRLGAPLLAIAAVVTAVVVCRDIARAHAWRIAAAAALAAVGVMAVAAVALPADVNRAVGFIRFDPSRALSTIVTNAAQLPAFVEMFYRTFWLAAGWLRYPGPPWWHAMTVAVCVTAVAGLIVEGWANRGRTLWLPVIAVGIQSVAVLAYTFGIMQFGPQGRYLFPVLPAIFCLVWLGWKALVGLQAPPRFAAASLVIIMVFLNNSAWVYVVLPAYL